MFTKNASQLSLMDSESADALRARDL